MCAGVLLLTCASPSADSRGYLDWDCLSVASPGSESPLTPQEGTWISELSREPNVAEETLTLGVARTQIASLVCAAGILGEKLPDKTSISSGSFAVKIKQNKTKHHVSMQRAPDEAH